ncbi:MAG: type II toxin-antitoxin system VapC family toxin [Calditrichaceae bacterium]|nr:type II toxin-antitoxin system VapC family toxin [Calditrichaceae bacterium]
MLIYHLAGEPIIENFFAGLQPVNDKLYCSFITYIELLGFPELTEEEKEKIQRLLALFEKTGISDSVEEKAIQIRASKRIKIPDAIVAASALHTNSILVTRGLSPFLLYH